MTIGVNANSIPKLSSQQAVNRDPERLSENIPKRGFNAADRVINDAGNRASPGGGQLQLTKQAMDVSWVLADQQRFERTQNRGEARSKETFAETANAIVE